MGPGLVRRLLGATFEKDRRLDKAPKAKLYEPARPLFVGEGKPEIHNGAIAVIALRLRHFVKTS